MLSLSSFRRSAVLFLACVSLASALSSGTVGCEGGKAAVSGLHTEQATVLTGPLQQDNIELQLNGVALQPGVPFDIELGVDYQWKLLTQGTFFRGFLVRLGRGDGNVDTRTSLDTSSATAQVADNACVNSFLVGGVTHTSNVLKNLEEGTLRVHLPTQNMPLDVTVVIQNRNGYSIYYYSQFTLNANPPDNQSASTVPGDGKPTIPTYTPYYPPPTAKPVYTEAPAEVYTPAPNASAPVYTAPPVYTPPPVSTSAPAAPMTAGPVDSNAPAPATSSPVENTPAPAPVATSATAAPVVEYLFLRFPTCSAETPCGACQGDCDTDEECAGSLQCFHRPQDDTSPVPGCLGPGVAGRDYCYASQPNSLKPRMPECSEENPCGACLGDCDSDDECAAGLKCATRGAGELTPIFGCTGLGIAGLDYCYNASAVSTAVDQAVGTDVNENSNVNGNSDGSLGRNESAAEQPEDFSSNDRAQLLTRDDPCSARDQCDFCEGDCKADDNKCSGDLVCFQRPDGDMTGVLGCPGEGDPGVDYCWRPIANTLVMRTRACNSQLPCAKCEGECNDNEQCASGLACYQRREMSVVPGCNGNGFSGVSMCWDPNDLQSTRHLLRH